MAANRQNQGVTSIKHVPSHTIKAAYQSKSQKRIEKGTMIIKVSDNRVFHRPIGIVRAFIPHAYSRSIQNLAHHIKTAHPDTIGIVVSRDGDFQNTIEENIETHECKWIQTPPTDSNGKKIALFVQDEDDVRFMGVFEDRESNLNRLIRQRISEEIEIPDPSMDALYCFTADKINDELINSLNDYAELHIAILENNELFCRTSMNNQIMFRPCCRWELLPASLATCLVEQYNANPQAIENQLNFPHAKRKDFITNDRTTLHITNSSITLDKLLPKIRDIIANTNSFPASQLHFIIRPINISPTDKRTKKANSVFQELLKNKLIHSCIASNFQINPDMPSPNDEKEIKPRNRIIFGAPGTGKSHKANSDANELLLSELKEDEDLSSEEKITKASRMERVTFHPEYSYFDFVGSYKPVMRDVPVMYVDGGILKTAEAEEGGLNTERKIEYDFVPGPFTRIFIKALKDKEHPYLLLIEEINRARVAAVFGDIFQLLDRTKGGESEYSICLSEDLKEHLKEQGLPLNELKLPPNLYIWATMNSADQGVYPLDTAFKRRWSMEYLSINEGAKNDSIGWNTIRKGINDLLKPHVNEDKLMGYHFLKEEERDTEEHLKEALAGKVLMYLFDDAAKPCRKDIFKEINKARIYSDLRAKLSLSEPNLGIFDGAIFWPVKNTTTGSDQDNAAPKAEEAEPVDNQQ